MQFPHLSDTQFPDLNTVDVYKFQNNFDYTRWDAKSDITLCNVRWTSDYTDVVAFSNNNERDAYFDELTNVHKQKLATAARVVPDGSVKVPIPYDVIVRYNYLFLDIPIVTSPNNKLDYETDNGVRRWYFFIDSITYLSPNATELKVTPDIWTNFYHDISISYMLLERGHAPVAYSNTDSYLQNPIGNNTYLLAPDVNFDNANINRAVEYVPFGNGEKWVCIASVCTPELLSQLGVVSVSSDYAPSGNISYSNVNARYGYQLEVHGLTFGNGYDFSQANTPAGTAYGNGNIPYIPVYAIKATECYGNGTFFKDIAEKCPQFLTTVKACFVVDENCIKFGTRHTLVNHYIYECVGDERKLLTKRLQQSDFNYPQELRRFAKLYTSPYSILEITDNDGKSVEVHIEETSTLTVNSVVSLAFPYINERVFIDGIGGRGSTQYSWFDLNGNTDVLQMPNSDWFKYCFDWKIPTFGLFMNGQTAFMPESFNRNVKQALRQALVNYHVSMRSSNTAYENACDQAAVAYTNTENSAHTARENSYRSADTGKINADNVAGLAKTNTYNAADFTKQNADNDSLLEQTNVNNNAGVSKVNAYNSADLSYTETQRSTEAAERNAYLGANGTGYVETRGIETSTANVNLNIATANVLTTNANLVIAVTTDQNIERSTSTALNSAVGGAISSGISGATTGATIGGGEGALVGGIAGVVGGGINVVTTDMNNAIVTNVSQTIADMQAAYNTAATREKNALASDSQNNINALRNDSLTMNSLVALGQMENTTESALHNSRDSRIVAKKNADNTKTTAETNAGNTRTTALTNSSNLQTLAKKNADNSEVTAKQNATNTKATSRANASDVYYAAVDNGLRTKNNVIANSGYTREVATLNAKEILENGKYTGLAAIDDARNASPVECCSFNGNPMPDYMQTRGLQIKVKTQSDSAIRQTGAVFARFGYTLNQVWDVANTGLNLMNHFTYWKAAEIWVSIKEAGTNDICNAFRQMFLNGITVWKKPNEIGAINVYGN